MKKQNRKQFHAGNHPSPLLDDPIKKVWHTDDDGTWWTGWLPSGITATQLLKLARSIEADLLRLYPGLE